MGEANGVSTDAKKENESQSSKMKSNSVMLARVTVAFWILGMCNNYIYVIMLSGAQDIISKTEQQPGQSANVTTTVEPPNSRHCQSLSTGAILLADIIPTLVVKLIAPFLPFYIHVRMSLVIISNVVALLLVAFSTNITIALLGVCFASFGSGLGEITLLAYSTSFTLHAIAGWSSGTGGAGLVGSFAYAGMIEAGLTPQTALLISLSTPILMAISFWLILKHPSKSIENRGVEGPEGDDNEESPKSESSKEKLESPSVKEMSTWETFKDRVCFIPKILKYMIPLGLVYFFEYLINSGIFELMYFKNVNISSASQFRWYNALYQIGVFISRSSSVLVRFHKIYWMTIFQGLNVIIFSLEAIYGYIPNIWVLFVLILWEGLLGGAAYVNTFMKMSEEVEESRRLFALGIASVADTFGIVTAGFVAFPVHDSICQLPYDPVFRWP